MFWKDKQYVLLAIIYFQNEYFFYANFKPRRVQQFFFANGCVLVSVIVLEKTMFTTYMRKNYFNFKGFFFNYCLTYRACTSHIEYGWQVTTASKFRGKPRALSTSVTRVDAVVSNPNWLNFSFKCHHFCGCFSKCSFFFLIFTCSTNILLTII